jgi:hypothetical protein
VLTGSVAREGFQRIAWRHPQVLERLRRVEHHEFAQRDEFDPSSATSAPQRRPGTA